MRPRPTPLRLAGFLVTIVGGTLIGVGSVMNWALVEFGGTSELRGIDIWEGRIALGISILILLGIPAMRGALTRAGRRAWAITIVVGAIVVGALALFALTAREDRLLFPGIDAIGGAPEGVRGSELAEALRDVGVRLRIGLGLWVTLAGSVIAGIGGVLGLIWAHRAPLPAAITDPAREPVED